MEQVKRKRGRPRKHPVVEITEVVKRPRGRPRKNPVEVKAVPEKPKLPYYILSSEDLSFWAHTTDREMYKQAVTDYNKIKKGKSQPEIRLFAGRIEVVAI